MNKHALKSIKMTLDELEFLETLEALDYDIKLSLERELVEKGVKVPSSLYMLDKIYARYQTIEHMTKKENA